MTEWVDLPADDRDDVELIFEVGVAERLLVHHVDVVRHRLVVHAPAAVDERKLLGVDELAHLRLGGVGLHAPPALEEGDLGVDELARRVARKALDHGGDHAANVGVLDRVVGPGVVLVDGLEPAGVVVRVRH